jgi:hypothetical protein
MDMEELKANIKKEKERQLALELMDNIRDSRKSTEPTYKVSTAVPAVPIAKLDPIALSERFTLTSVRIRCMNDVYNSL